jgi:hypothetical protein
MCTDMSAYGKQFPSDGPLLRLGRGLQPSGMQVSETTGDAEVIRNAKVPMGAEERLADGMSVYEE